MIYQAKRGVVVYRSKDGREVREFASLDWLSEIISHIPNRGEQMVRYYGYYSNASRGMRRKVGRKEAEPVNSSCSS